MPKSEDNMQSGPGPVHKKGAATGVNRGGGGGRHGDQAGSQAGEAYPEYQPTATDLLAAKPSAGFDPAGPGPSPDAIMDNDNKNDIGGR